ncbi:DUF1127 domain-containing protein [Bradyrhizobium sp. Pa8]|uniref:DUF1127 domain-containing protein n=1 Tax=Bradyrhizobium sp. Pa8 TaxID=3386552 RepID=UPI00403F1256
MVTPGYSDEHDLYCDGIGADVSVDAAPPNFLKSHFDAFCACRIRQTFRATLDDLSELELRDIGITRGEIEYLVQGSLDRPTRSPRPIGGSFDWKSLGRSEIRRRRFKERDGLRKYPLIVCLLPDETS